MKSKKIFNWLILLVLIAGLLPATVAADPPEPKPEPPVEATMSTTAPAGGGIESLSGSFVEFDPSVGGDPCFVPGATQTLCFRAESYSPDWEYVYNLWQKFPTDWTVLDVYVQGTPVCDSGGSWGSFSWSFHTPPYEVNISHARYHSSAGDHCTAYYCFEVVSGTGTPDALESWYWDGDGYGNTPHWPCSDDNYTPSGQSACDEALLPQAAVPECTALMLTPEQIDAAGCACEPQQHDLNVLNNAGYDMTVDLSYSIIAGAGDCSGPASVLVPTGGSEVITVDLYPVGSPGDVVVCEIYAEDSSDPGNNDTSWINKELIAGGFDPAGWQLEDITGATGNQWAGGTVGTNPAAAGPVGYIVGGLGVGSSVPNPDLQMYDPDTATWTQLTDMPNQRFSPVVGWMGGLLYAAGGYDPAFVATNDLQVYDPATDTWDNTNPLDMPNIRGGGAGGVGTCSSGAGECLFHVGGGPDSSFANTTLETWEYDPGANTWTQLDNKPAGSSPDGHILGAGVGCMGHVYVGGDYRGFHEFYRLDATQPIGSQWTQMANIPPSAGAMTPALVCKEDIGAILLIGGDPDGNWGNYNNTVYIYDIATDTWDGPMPQTLNVAQLGSVAWHMYDKVWTAGGTVGSGAIDPMPFESLAQIFCDPGACLQFEGIKVAPPVAEFGEVISYTLIVSTTDLMPGMIMTDVLPVGVEYAGNLTWTVGDAWYDAGDNAVYWTSPPPPKAASAAPAPLAPAAVGTAADAADVVGGPEAAGPPAPTGPVPTFAYPEAVLWDNGPMITHPGGGFGGADASVLQTNLGLSTYGFGHQLSYGYRMADGFEITDPGGWQIDAITFFAYQTNSPTDPSPIDHVNYRIWDGPPDDPTSSVVFGDTSTNRLVNSEWTNIYRVTDYDMMGTARPIMADTCSAGVWLPPGDYWLDWQTGGILTSGPWAPPISILGETTTGDSLQSLDNGVSWAPAVDTGTSTGQGMPFIIEGSGAVTTPEITFDVTVTGHCGDLIVNEAVLAYGPATDVFSATTEVIGEPDIVVDPPALGAEVCPDATDVLTFTICNQGDCPLDWALSEDIPWLSEDPTSGSVPWGECQEVEVTFDAAGTAPGDYTGDLVVVSNDPDMPTVDVPVSMTVLEPVAIDAVDWMTDGCQVSFDSTVMGAEPYTYLWDFGDGVGTSIEADPVYTYTAPGGCYTVTLEVSNECGTDTWEGLVCATCEEPPPPYHYIYLPIVIRD